MEFQRDTIEQLFASMLSAPSTDPTRPLLWGYFFTGADPDLLDTAARELESRGYSFVDIYRNAETDPDLWWLHVERVEQHTVDSLLSRNAEFNELALRFGLEDYDGMDVGPRPD